MLSTIPDSLLFGLSDFLATKIGIYFPKGRWGDMVRGMNSAAHELGFTDAESCVRWLLSSSPARKELETLASHLTVGETYFFREPASFDAVEKHILANQIRNRRGKNQHLRIWSAGCATGEEPYTVAIMLHRLIPDISDWNITILATDINPLFLQKAAQGSYSEWSFRGVPAEIKKEYFEIGKDGRLQIIPQIRRMVAFAYLNFAEDVYPSLANGTNAMDLIFCRNVLMYFSLSFAKQVVEKLRHSLIEGGCLVVSPVETSNSLFSSFVPVVFEGVTLYANTRTRIGQLPDVQVEFETAGPDMEIVAPSRTIAQSVQLGIGLDECSSSSSAASRQPVCNEPESFVYTDAWTLYREGRYAEASEKIAEALAGDPGNIQAMELMARSLANQGRLREAAAWCEKAIARDKLRAEGHHLLASIEQERGRLNEAIAALKRALYLNPGFVLAHFTLGNLARAQGKYKESEKHIANALSLLDRLAPESVLPESEGMTARRLKEVIQAMGSTGSSVSGMAPATTESP